MARIAAGILVILLAAGCSDNHADGNANRNEYAAIGLCQSRMLADKWPDDSAEYRNYQSFDIFTLEGIGNVVKSPFVYVRESPSLKIVRVSDDIDNPYIFIKIDDYWYTSREYFMDRDYSEAVPMGEPCPQKIMRFIRNDTIYELRQIFTLRNISLNYKIYNRNGYLALYSDNQLDENHEIRFSKDLFADVIDSIKMHKQFYDTAYRKIQYGSEYTYKRLGDSWIKTKSTPNVPMKDRSSYKLLDYPIMFLNDKEHQRRRYEESMDSLDSNLESPQD